MRESGHSLSIRHTFADFSFWQYDHSYCGRLAGCHHQVTLHDVLNTSFLGRLAKESISIGAGLEYKAAFILIMHAPSAVAILSVWFSIVQDVIFVTYSIGMGGSKRQ